MLPQAAIAHDRYHIKRHLLQAVEQVRRAEHKQLSKQGDTRLCGTRFLFLRNAQNWSEKDARGYRYFQNYRTAILFHCGKLDLLPHY